MAAIKTRNIRNLLVCLGLFGLVIGPWPVPNELRTASRPLRDTMRRIDRSLPVQGQGQLHAGVAEIDITPSFPVPTAGFLDQIWQPVAGINSRCFARALTVTCGPANVTILTADLLLIDARLVRQILARTGLAREQIYFTATHTHGGPGGWGNHPLERLVAGTFDAEATTELADRLAQVVLASRASLQPVEVAFLQTEAGGLQQNRIFPGEPTNDRLSAWVFRTVTGTPGKPAVLATLASFGAHATVAHPKPSRLGGDYPAAFAAALRQRDEAGIVLFAAGTVGDASPIRPRAVNQQQSARIFGEALADQLAALLASAEFHRQIELANLGIDVDLPPVQVPFLTGWLRFSPLAVWWVGRPRTYLHTVRLGPAFLSGFPGDIAGHLARRLDGPDRVVATSFNGDYKGYLVTQATFRDRACYETRAMSFFGPGLGESLVDLSQRCIRRIQATSP